MARSDRLLVETVPALVLKFRVAKWRRSPATMLSQFETKQTLADPKGSEAVEAQELATCSRF